MSYDPYDEVAEDRKVQAYMSHHGLTPAPQRDDLDPDEVVPGTRPSAAQYPAPFVPGSAELSAEDRAAADRWTAQHFPPDPDADAF